MQDKVVALPNFKFIVLLYVVMVHQICDSGYVFGRTNRFTTKGHFTHKAKGP